MSRTTLTAALVNAMLRPTTGGRKRPLETWEKAVAQVQESTGWSVEGEEQFIADLGFHLKCLADEPRLTPFGWQSGLLDAKSRLENRLRIRQRLQEPLGRQHTLRYAGRPASAAPACGYYKMHGQQQRELVASALAEPPARETSGMRKKA